jgi:hypothetical protein
LNNIYLRKVGKYRFQDQWNKETEDKVLLTSAIKHIAHKNMKQIKEWTKEHPEYNDYTTKQNDRYFITYEILLKNLCLDLLRKKLTKII